jgi:hypothetical protein
MLDFPQSHSRLESCTLQQWKFMKGWTELTLFKAQNAINAGLSTKPQLFRKLYTEAMEVYERLDCLSLFKA